METAVKYLIDRHLSPVARVYRKLRDRRWFAGLKEVRTSIGLTLIAEPGLADAIQEYNDPDASRAVSDGDVFVDLGAHLGLYSCIAARMRKYVIAVEPHPLGLQLLYRTSSATGSIGISRSTRPR